ncbi:MAG TPA: carboxymuconolactone decarboxylase family protein [Abditibacteriaceae bacterium]|jgi:alkylhydroperoxidase/carboxymuconolactone decarboxylase family protein YurZ
MKNQVPLSIVQALCTALPLAMFSFAQAAPASKTKQSVPKAVTTTVSDLPVVSSGQKTDLKLFLMPERPTVFAFYKPSSTLERDFVRTLQQDAHNKIGFQVIQLKTGSEPIAAQYEIKETPTALVFDRRGRLVGRSSNGEEIRAQVGQALRVMRIDWAEEGDPRLDSVQQMLGGQKNVPDILRTMSLRPDYLQGFMAMSMKAQFTDGFIDRRTKELIATYVSAINKCKY